MGLPTQIETNRKSGPNKPVAEMLSNVPELKSLTSANNNTKSTEPRFESDVNVVGEVADSSINLINQQTNSSNHNGSTLWQEESKLTTVAETFGTGANKSVNMY